MSYELDDISSLELKKRVRLDLCVSELPTEKYAINSDWDNYGVLFTIEDFVIECLTTNKKAFVVNRDDKGCINEIETKELSPYLFLLIVPSLTSYEGLYLGPYQELFFSIIEELKLPSVINLSPKIELLDGRLVADVFNSLVSKIRSHKDLGKIKQRHYSLRFQSNKNAENADALVDELFAIFNWLLIIRIDFGYKEHLATEVSPERLEKDIDAFMNKHRKLSVMKHKVGHIIDLEYGRKKGPHVHCIFIFDGNKRKRDKWIGEKIGEYWVDKITAGDGTMFNCNRRRKKYFREYIGLVHKDNEVKRTNLSRVGIRYLTKTDQVFRAKLSPKSKTFRISRITPDLQAKKKVYASKGKQLEQIKNAPLTDVELTAPTLSSELHIRLGSCIDTGESEVWDPLNLDNGFLRIMGASGSGKTETLKWITLQLCQKGMPVLLFDYHGDVVVPGMEDILLSSGTSSFWGVNPMELNVSDFNQTGLIDHIEDLFDMVKQAFDNISTRQSEILYMALEEAYRQAGIIESNPATWSNQAPRFSDVIEILTSFAEDPPPGTIRASYTSCIAAIRKLFRYPIFDRAHNLSVPYLANRRVRLNLSKTLSYDIKFVVTETILKMLFKVAREAGPVPAELQGSKQKFRMFVVIDEAGILCMGQGDPNNPRTILNVLMREARKFGIAIVVASQMSNHFGRDVTANAAASLVLKTSDPKEAKNNADSIGVGAEDVLGLSEVGTGYFKTKSSNSVSLVKIEPGKIE